MKIALVDAFPNLSHSAEREFIRRCITTLQKAGHEAHGVTTSDDIIALDPEIVIVTHEFVAKVTDHYTVGLFWSPTEFYKNDEARLKAIRSWDLVVPINAATRQFAKNLHFPLRHRTAVSDLNFYPSAQVSPLPLPNPSDLSLAYIGAHWDGYRHKALFEEIAKVTDFHVYGPPKAWEFFPTTIGELCHSMEIQFLRCLTDMVRFSPSINSNTRKKKPRACGFSRLVRRDASLSPNQCDHWKTYSVNVSTT